MILGDGKPTDVHMHVVIEFVDDIIPAPVAATPTDRQTHGPPSTLSGMFNLSANRAHAVSS
jgi:hypothetical protein